ncbi:hypothetical protein HY993_00170 [Candidatus Micrarchaeota archaeon]|nr:hypothetical protein [Candidatus Micrarchaeota archaeon]
MRIKPIYIPIALGILILAICARYGFLILTNQIKSSDEVTFLGVILGAAIGFLGLYYVELSNTQTIWKKEQAKQINSEVYNPAYNNLLTRLNLLKKPNAYSKKYLIEERKDDFFIKLAKELNPKTMYQLTIFDKKLIELDKKIDNAISKIKEISFETIKQKNTQISSLAGNDHIKAAVEQINQHAIKGNFGEIYYEFLFGEDWTITSVEKKNNIVSRITENMGNQAKIGIMNLNLRAILDEIYKQIETTGLRYEINKEKMQTIGEGEKLKEIILKKMLEPEKIFDN